MAEGLLEADSGTARMALADKKYISLALSWYKLLSLRRLPLTMLKLLVVSPITLAISLAMIWYVVLTTAFLMLLIL